MAVGSSQVDAGRQRIVGIALVGLGACAALYWFDDGGSPPDAPLTIAPKPTTAPLAMATATEPLARIRVGREPASPSTAAAPTPGPYAPPSGTLHTWIDDLVHDDVRWNATRAATQIRQLGPDAIPMLDRALWSLDVQQRHFAETLLRELDAEPTTRLAEVVVDGLRTDLPAHLAQQLKAREQRVLFLQRHANIAIEPLQRGLWSDDPTQRFLCAYLLARTGHAASAPSTCPLLIEHLADNVIPSDALLSCHALYHLGDAARPFVRAALATARGQSLMLLQLIERDLTDPPSTRADLEARKAMHRVTGVYFDPAIELDLAKTPLPTLR